jgi:hypothetical protein
MLGVSASYKCGTPYGEIHITTLYKTKYPELLGVVLAGESVGELDLI